MVSAEISELFARVGALAHSDDHDAWDPICTLRKVGSREVLGAAISLTRSGDPHVRERGVAILGQLGIPDRTFPDECFEAIAPLARREEDKCVLEGAIFALGHLHHPSGIEVVTHHADHEDEDIRYAVAFALGGRSEPQAIDTLIRLTKDPDDDVRDWATFGLGEIGNADTPEIRQALFDRLDDPHCDTRYEAMTGLARCGDPRAVPFVIAALRHDPDDESMARHGKAFLSIDERSEICIDDLIEQLARLKIEHDL